MMPSSSRSDELDSQNASHSSRAPLRVLLLLHSLGLTGAPRIALDALQAMGEAVQVRIIAPESGPFEARCRLMGELDLLSLLSTRGPLLRKVRNRKSRASLSAELKQWKPDVIYANTVATLPLVAQLDLPDAPVLLHVHEQGQLLNYYARARPDLMTRWPTRYIAVAEDARRALIDEHRIAVDRIALIHEFVPDRDWEAAASLLQQAPRDDGRFVVGGAGVIQWRKGVEMWLHMAAELKEIMGDRARFVWVGVGEDLQDEYFRESARKLGLEDAIEFVPITTEPMKHYARFDAFAMTSWEDPCPLVVLENMMLEKPVVCFAGGGGAREEVAESGVVIGQFRPRAMAEALAQLADDPARRKALGQAARARVQAHFTDRVQVPKLRDELERAASRQSTAHAAT